MTTAICYSGEARTFAKCLPNQWHMVLRHFPDAHVFASVADDEDAKDMELLRQYFPADRVTIEAVKQPDDIQGPADLERAIAAGPHKIAAHSTVQGVLRQFWQMERVWDMVLKALGGDLLCDMAIRIRPDLVFHSAPSRWPKVNPYRCLSPWWSRAGGINDRFAIMGSSAADVYFHTLTWAQRVGWEKGSPIHPESMLAACFSDHFSKNEATLPATFSFLRKSGEMILPDPTLADLADLQIALAERNDQPRKFVAKCKISSS